jgi:hypothetical protein
MERRDGLSAPCCDQLMTVLAELSGRVQRRLDTLDRHAAELMFLQVPAQEVVLGQRRRFSLRDCDGTSHPLASVRRLGSTAAAYAVAAAFCCRSERKRVPVLSMAQATDRRRSATLRKARGWECPRSRRAA